MATPTFTPTPTATFTPEPTATVILTATATPASVYITAATATPTARPTATVTPEPMPTFTPTAMPTPKLQGSKVVLQGVDLVGEVVTLVNQGDAPQNMSGWVLFSVVGEQRFVFPSGFTLASGATVKVTSGDNAYADPPNVLQWLKADGMPSKAFIWNNASDPAVLYDNQGNVVSTFP
ncbi:MAG: lamin tail domain-containing protein [Dehalococcoidia bacterium]|nr:lamin tail domain-containing protein [Dehalococcoidia bacterium]